MSYRFSDVLVIGDGVIGLSTAQAVATAGLSCTIVGVENPGMASGAAAGLIAPSIGTLEPSVEKFYYGSVASYREFLEPLRAFDPELRFLPGLIEVCGPNDARTANRVNAAQLRGIEPSLNAPFGAVMHPNDGAIDNVRLVGALRLAVASEPKIRRLSGDPAVALVLDGTKARVQLESGSAVDADTIVLAAGAWAPRLRGLPRPIPISPLKGQMLAVASSAPHSPVMGNDVYLVPREHEVVIGATVEHAGFDTTVDPAAIAQLHRLAAELCPPLGDAQVLRTWAGIRPATPDMRPILGRDPDVPALVYACGHSKNGILLAPATARSIATLVAGGEPPYDLTPFSIVRFQR